MPNQIAVGVDGSSASRAALEWAMRRARRDGDSAVLLHATGNTARSKDEIDSMVNAELEHARASSPGVSVRVEIHDGGPVTVLADESPRFTIMVVGTHKTGFLRGRAFGSTSVRLAALTRAPLAVVPIPSGRTRNGVVVGIDDSPYSSTALRFAAHEADRAKSTLTLIHVQEAANPSLMNATRDVVRDLYPALVTRTREIDGVAGEILTKASTAAELLVLGARPAGAVLGAVAFDVLLNISGPTIVVPSEVLAITTSAR